MNIEISHPQPHNVYAMKKMWEMCFGDEDEYINLFFDNCFKIELALVAYCDLKPAGMLFMLPVKMKLNQKDYNGIYLYAVCTKPAFQKQGVMSRLMIAVHKLALTQNLDFLCLVPASESLFKMYEKFNFKTTFYLSEKNILSFPDNHVEGIRMRVCSKEDFLYMRTKFLDSKTAYADFLPPFDEYRYLEFKKAGGSIYHVEIDEQEHYIAGYTEKDSFIICETTLENEKLQRVLPLIANEKDTSFFKAKGLKGNIDKINPYGMMKWINPEINASLIKSLHPYLNMMLE